MVVVLAAGTRLLAVEPLHVDSVSMAPTLQAGDRVLVEKISLRFAAPSRGDIVVFEHELGAGLAVKRVVGLAGDEVGLEDGVLVVNGEPADERYVDLARVEGVYFGPVEVPEGTVFVMGDNRAESIDSRTYGAVPLSDLAGRVVLRRLPPLLP